jgi:hypothetical protein
MSLPQSGQVVMQLEQYLSSHTSQVVRHPMQLDSSQRWQ